MKYSLLMVGLFITLRVSATAPDDSLRTLLTQREQAIRDYQYYNEQNSNFWGKKSKKDLLRIIDTLKEIIRKDTDIINTIKASTLRQAAAATVQQSRLQEQVKDDQVVITDNLYALKSQLANLQNLQKVRQRQITELKEEASQVKQRQTTRDFLITLAVVLILGLLLYIFKLRRKLELFTGKE